MLSLQVTRLSLKGMHMQTLLSYKLIMEDTLAGDPHISTPEKRLEIKTKVKDLGKPEEKAD
jgi:hypothetical protein